MFKKIVAVVGFLPLAAFAAVPVAVTDAITAMQNDGVTVATAFLVAFFTIYAIQYLRRTK
ncbi:MAG: major capsid protein [Rugosibacter sp.]|nr:major capsid protein [Rugosibacter sp.]